jgi:sugar-phosphatase
MRREECIKYWFEAHSISGFSHDIVAGEFVDAVVQLFQSKAVPMRGAVELIQRLHALGLKLAVASQSPLSVISATVAKFGVEDCFQLLHTAEDEEQGKPHPAVYQTVLSRLGVDAGCCIAFEDAVSGVQSANAAGLRVYAVPAPSDYNRTEFDIAEAKLRSLSDFPISDLK